VTSPVPTPESAYWRFYARVAAEQLAAWAPAEPSQVLDLSGVDEHTAALVQAGHTVVHACPPEAPVGPKDVQGPGELRSVVADARSLDWVADGAFDAVLAEGRALSMCLAAEVAARDLARVLRPGGRLLIVVESLVLGLARLADSGRWAELADVPSADVVLVPTEDGQVVRCFWPEELVVLLEEAGFDVEWVRPRSVLSVAAVERAMAAGGDEALETLVRTELALAEDREGESTGLHLVASARRR
jgi:SAM-dependent methyltransferase